MILAGDVGGTKTVLALFDTTEAEPALRAQARYASADFEDFDALVDRFLEEFPEARPERACLGVAGVVRDGQVETTNLPWKLDESRLAQRTGATRVRFLNDLEAAAYGILALPDSQREVLQEGERAGFEGNIAVVAAGTGLGEAILYWDGTRHHAIATEGGHTSFGPRDDEQVELLRWLSRQHEGHVSYERILSGRGFFDLYRFLRQASGQSEPTWLRDRLSGGQEDPSATVTRAGLEDADPVCRGALELFCRIYGDECANLALKCLSTGGVFIGGGIAPKMLAALRQGGFLSAFHDKGRFRPLLESVHVSVSLEPLAPLFGAARYAATRL